MYQVFERSILTANGTTGYITFGHITYDFGNRHVVNCSKGFKDNQFTDGSSRSLCWHGISAWRSSVPTSRELKNKGVSSPEDSNSAIQRSKRKAELVAFVGP